MFYRQVLGLGHRKSPKELYDAIGKLLPIRLKAPHRSLKSLDSHFCPLYLELKWIMILERGYR